MNEIRIVHCADLHIGLSFGGSRYSEQVSAALKAERLLALDNIVRLANAQRAHFLVIAGDLFDRVNTGLEHIQKTIKSLTAFDGEIIILPGNHDFYEEAGEGLWQRFVDLSTKLRLTLLAEERPYTFDTEAGKVVFYPGVCKSKHADHHVIGWVKDKKEKEALLHIGVAHGNVEGYGMGADRYFNMKPEDLKAATLDLWLLGHIHVPSQDAGFNGKAPLFLFPGSHTPDGFDRIGQHGHCWSLTYTNGSWTGSLEKTSNVLFREEQFSIYTQQDIDQVQQQLKRLTTPGATLLKLQLQGRLSAKEIKACYEMIESFRSELFHLEYEKSLQVKIDQEYIESRYAQESLPYVLLNTLSQHPDDELALQLAAGMLEEDKIRS